MNTPASEQRLEQLREKAWQEGVVPGRGVDVVGGPIPRKPGYYGQPVVKPPVWTWEVPLYFFFGGIGGMSAVIAFGAVLFHQVDLARAAMWSAAVAGAVLSPILLIMDLGRPHLFLNMLRVFKHRSAMSMGAWILTAFGTCVVSGSIALELHAHEIIPGALGQLLRVAAGIFISGAAILGTLLATYTGVLIGATAIPAWFLHRWDTESRRSTLSDFTPPRLSSRSSFGSVSTNTAQPIARFTNMVLAGRFALAKC